MQYTLIMNLYNLKEQYLNVQMLDMMMEQEE